MKFSQILLAAASASFAAAKYVRCGTPNVNATQMAAMDAVVEASDARVMAAAAISVDVYVHVVTTTAKKGRYTQAMVNEQIAVMNDAYSSIGVSYKLLATDFTVNDAWATAKQSSSAESAMKKALKRGSYAQLDLYFISDLGDGLLGFCYLPLASPTTTDRALDGCVNLAASLPGAEATNYDMGLTAVHEIGHWFGLYHVFQGQSCSGSGDGVSDTPIQKVATEGCPTSQDSCPNSAGADNIHNYMDYSYDACMYEFTSGQNSRATSLYQRYRAGK